jgi:hypothetical protein
MRLKKNLFTFCLAASQLVLITIAVHAQRPETEDKFLIGISSGYSREHLNWSIAGQTSASTDVNILSELDWKKLSGISFGLDVEYNFYKRFVLLANLSALLISSGNVTDTDYGEDDRKNMLFRGEFNSNKGTTLGMNAGLGYKLMFLKTVTFTLHAGYGVEQQNLFMLGNPGNVTGDLKSTYKTIWNGMFIGYQVEVPVCHKISIQHRLTYHQVNYSAKANWNLIEEYKHPVSFKHRANGFGIVPELCVLFKMNHRMNISAGGRYGYWKTGTGTDTLYRSNGETNMTQFNGATRHGITLITGVAFSF